jgi:hypothetical protein
MGGLTLEDGLAVHHGRKGTNRLTGNIDDREAVAPLKHMGCPLYPDEPTPSA